MHSLSCNRKNVTELLFLLLRILFIACPARCAKYHSTAQNSNERQVQRFAMEPQDQTEIVGSRVILPCRVIDKVGLIQWTKDDFGLGVHRNLSGFDRYSMVGSDEEGSTKHIDKILLDACQIIVLFLLFSLFRNTGDFSLNIYPVMLDDDAKYQCQVSPGKDGMFQLFI